MITKESGGNQSADLDFMQTQCYDCSSNNTKAVSGELFCLNCGGVYVDGEC